MNKRRFFYTVLLMVLLLIGLSSCRSDGPAGTDITGLWFGYVYTSNADINGPVVFEFESGGGMKMGDTEDIIIYDEAIQQNYIWSLGDDYLTVLGSFGMYFGEYAYDLDEETLSLVLIRRNFYNDTYDELSTGDRLVLEKDTDTEHKFSDYFDGSIIIDSFYSQ